ncbi:hypothetical protein BH11ARM2_BH11ARM2_10370 [soil metagenome]
MRGGGAGEGTIIFHEQVVKPLQNTGAVNRMDACGMDHFLKLR